MPLAMIRLLRLASTLATGVLVQLTGCVANSSPRSLTPYKLRALHSGVTLFRDAEGRLPAVLGDVCLRDARWCRLYAPDEWLRDGWGTAIRYSSGVSDYLLRSAGEDRTFGSADDVVFDSAEEGRLVSSMVGCYLLSARLRGVDSDTLRLSGTLSRSGGYVIESPFDGIAEWYPQGPDSVTAAWIHIDRGVTLKAVVHGDSLRGKAGRATVSARRVGCQPDLSREQ